MVDIAAVTVSTRRGTSNTIQGYRWDKRRFLHWKYRHGYTWFLVVKNDLLAKKFLVWTRWSWGKLAFLVKIVIFGMKCNFWNQSCNFWFQICGYRSRNPIFGLKIAIFDPKYANLVPNKPVLKSITQFLISNMPISV